MADTIVTGAVSKTAMVTAYRDTCADGTLEILSSADVVIAIFGLSASGGTISGSTWNFAYDASGATTGLPAAGSATQAAKARIKRVAGSVEVSGMTVTLPGGGGSVQLNNVWISNGQDVGLSSGSLSWP